MGSGPDYGSMGDLVVVVPGILGSVLSNATGEIWGTPGALFQTLLRFDRKLIALRLKADDASAPTAPDGVQATALVTGATLIPGFWQIAGYSGLMRWLREAMSGAVGTEANLQNLIGFPYDWRRDNRISARLLGSAVDEHLRRWRETSRNPEAKVILVAHSMGGLVSRYYVEALGGWRQCRALVTFGTPHYGSMKALKYISNGLRFGPVDLSELVSTLPSVAQLLPTYRGLYHGTDTLTLKEAKELLPWIDPAAIDNSAAFNEEIEHAVARNREDRDYCESPYLGLAVAGWGQNTLQAATIGATSVTLESQLPGPLERYGNSGDGTVPLISAVPADWREQYRDVYVAEGHGFLQQNNYVAQYLHNRISAVGAAEPLPPIRAIGPGSAGMAERPGIPLDVEDHCSEAEVLQVHATALNTSAAYLPLRCQLRSVTTGASEWSAMVPQNGAYTTQYEGLSPDLYRLTVAASADGSSAPPRVRGLVEVLPSEFT